MGQSKIRIFGNNFTKLLLSFSMLNCKNTNVNLATVHDLIKILSPPRNLLLFYNIPPGCLGEVQKVKVPIHNGIILK